MVEPSKIDIFGILTLTLQNQQMFTLDLSLHYLLTFNSEISFHVLQK